MNIVRNGVILAVYTFIVIIIYIIMSDPTAQMINQIAAAGSDISQMSSIVSEVKAVLGIETDTFDSEGKVLRRSDNEVTKEELERVLREFSGDIWQTPPSYSAKKITGRKAYQLARKGMPVDIPPKKVSIYSLELKEFQFPYFTIACEVSSGFYVRSLAHDIGDKLKVGATVTEVRRTRVGPYRVEQAKCLDEILG